MNDRFGYCTGCGRTRDEIARWTTISPGQQAMINAQLPARLKRMKPSLLDSLRHLVAGDQSA